MKVLLALLCSLLIDCASGIYPSSAPAKRLVGKWYQGDGLGYNVSLILEQNSAYNAVWTGCGGTYGTARGNWRSDQSKITLLPTEEKGMMRSYLRALDVVPDKRGFVLVAPQDRAYLKKHGSWSSVWCFKRSD